MKYGLSKQLSKQQIAGVAINSLSRASISMITDERHELTERSQEFIPDRPPLQRKSS
jgi:hypothetical protein